MSTNQVAKQIEVVDQASFNHNQVAEKAALFDSSGNPLSLASATTMLLTGYVVGSPVDIAATDTVVEAFGKVQALIYNLISRVEDLETP